MVRSGSWWFVVVCGGLWWFVVVSLKFSRKYHVTHYVTNQSPSFSIRSHFELDFVMVRGGFVVVRGGSSWFVMVRHGS